MLKIGADPELFCFDENNKRFVSAHTFFPGTKDKPFPVEDGALQLDGLAAELNIDPAETSDQFVTLLNSVMNTARKFLPPGVILQAIPSVTFDPTDYAAIPAENKVIGCTPDHNAWNYGDENPIPQITVPSLRAAGGHIHLGWTDNAEGQPDHMMMQLEIIKQLDCLVGLQCLLWDPPNERKALYGKAGAFRPKPYGVEYRTPSNYWLSSSDKMKTVFDLTKKAWDAYNAGIFLAYDLNEDVEKIINNDDKKAAQHTLERALKLAA